MYKQYNHEYESDPFAEDTVKAGQELVNIIILEEQCKSG